MIYILYTFYIFVLSYKKLQTTLYFYTFYSSRFTISRVSQESHQSDSICDVSLPSKNATVYAAGSPLSRGRVGSPFSRGQTVSPLGRGRAGPPLSRGTAGSPLSRGRAVSFLSRRRAGSPLSRGRAVLPLSRGRAGSHSPY